MRPDRAGRGAPGSRPPGRGWRQGIARRHGGWLMAALVLLAACAAPAARRPAPAAPAAADSPSAAAPAAPQAAATSAPLTTLTIQVPTKGAPFVHLYAAQSLGIFRRHGLDARIVAMSPATAAAGLQSGEVDLMAAIGSATRAALRGVPLRVVYVAANKSDHLFVGAKGIGSFEQLRGQVVTAYAPANTINAMTVELMGRHGLGPNDYQLLNAGDGSARAATVVNDLAAASLLDSAIVIPLLDQGYPVLARAADEIELPFTGLAAATAKIQQQRDVVKRAIQATHETVRLAASDPNAVVPVAVEEFGLSAADASRLLGGLRDVWSVDGFPSRAALEFESRTVQQELELPEPVQQEQVYDLSLLEELRVGR